MMHYSCDACGKRIDKEHETRFVVRLEVYASVDDQPESLDTEIDHLEEIEDLLERLDGPEDLEDELYKQVRYDLCPDCRHRLMSDPLGRLKGVKLGFSNN